MQQVLSGALCETNQGVAVQPVGELRVALWCMQPLSPTRRVPEADSYTMDIRRGPHNRGDSRADYCPRKADFGFTKLTSCDRRAGVFRGMQGRRDQSLSERALSYQDRVPGGQLSQPRFPLRRLKIQPTRRYSINYFKFNGYLCDVRLWPKADIRTRSRSAFLNGCFGEQSGHWLISQRPRFAPARLFNYCYY